MWSLVLEREVDGSSTYTAMTTRGAITTVEKFLLTTYLLGFPDLKRPAHRGTPPPSFISRVGFGVPVEKARTITERGQTVRMVVTGRIAGGTIEEDDAKKATLSSPTEYLNRQKILPVRPGQVTLRLAETNETLATLGGSAVLEPRED